MKRILSFLFLLALTACGTAVAAPPTLTATVPPTDTIVPTSTLPPTLTTTPVPSGPCDNPFLPLATGNEWTYRVTGEGGEALYTLKTLDRNDGRNIVIMVEFTDQKNNVTVVEPVVCTDGAIENFPLFVMIMHFSDYLEGNFNTYHDTGTYAPSYPTLAENNWSMDWELKYLTEDGVSLRNPTDGTAFIMGQSVPINLSFKTDGTREAVTVPAGNYPQALKAPHSFSFSGSLFLPTGVTASIFTLNTTQWYEPYVGLVRAQVDSASLFFYKQDTAVPMVSVIELVEFKKGK
ncbi:MAG: hypothetical protein HYZ21_16670 [Chloroflexi bacterium]|nr:hypothetical protein [Chloroflexota bacterium]